MKSWLKKFQLILSITVTILVMVYLLLKVNIAAVAQTVSNASFSWIAAGFLFFIFYQVFRTARFSWLFHSRKGELLNLFSVQCIHAFLNNILPAGTGELAYIVVLRRLYRIPITEGATTLYLARTADLMTFVVLFGIWQALDWEQMPPIVELAMQIMAVLTGLLVIVAVCVSVVDLKWIIKLRNDLVTGSKSHSQWLAMGFDKVVNVIRSFQVIRSTKVYVAVLLLSTVMWMFMYLTYFAVIHGLRLQLNPGQVLFLFLVMWSVNILPVKGILNLGTFEAGWLLGLVLLGVSESTGIAVALGAHVILFLYAVGVLIFPIWIYGPNLLNILLKQSVTVSQTDR